MPAPPTFDLRYHTPALHYRAAVSSDNFSTTSTPRPGPPRTPPTRCPATAPARPARRDHPPPRGTSVSGPTPPPAPSTAAPCSVTFTDNQMFLTRAAVLLTLLKCLQQGARTVATVRGRACPTPATAPPTSAPPSPPPPPTAARCPAPAPAPAVAPAGLAALAAALGGRNISRASAEPCRQASHRFSYLKWSWYQ